MKTPIALLSFLFLSVVANAQRHVSQERMAEVYEEAKTPYKYGMVIAPEDNNHKIDCPTVFRENGKWYMTYVVYNGRGGQDGRGYETWLAESDNLLEWKTLGRLLSYRDGYWDEDQRGGFPSLIDMEWGGSYELQKYKGRHWMTYLGGNGTGYEAINAPLHIGMAWTKESPAKAHEWEAKDKPLLSINDKDVQWWEKLVQYKSMVYWDKDETLGHPFVMFYNAGGIHPVTKFKSERVGIALSDNMKKWKRYDGNPVFTHEAQGTITGDAQIQKMGDVYVMFYFSAFNPTRDYKAYNTFACSYDLVTWDDWQGADLIYPTKDYDEMFAHKSFVLKHDGVVYHFYCAVNNDDQRGIAVATSKPMGRSKVSFPARPVKGKRTVVELNDGWTTWMTASEFKAGNSKQNKTSRKQMVNIPHNWDDYYGYRQLTHGNLHGTAMYEKVFEMPKTTAGKRTYLRFEGVGTYATVTLNGKDFGRHPVGRTTLTLDVTDAVKPEGKNKLLVKAEHPSKTTDMPWVCGGCSSEWGFSEGSQPLGIFRPVVLEITDEVRIAPYGVHIWHNDAADSIFIDTEITNKSTKTETVELVNKFSNAMGNQVFRLKQDVVLAPGETKVVRQQSPIVDPILWSTEKPYLYALTSMVKRGGKSTDELTTPFGIRTISWPVKRNDGDGRFFLNGRPVFINGVCEYEHQFGQSHAFSHEQVSARVKQMLNAGFNAFRDAHQPHHLDYQSYWDKHGILFWTQLSAHVWYDTPEFRNNFKTLLRQWVKERRNSPSVVMWGLQNESTLPADFAKECADIIREMDPTARNMRIITTCNGGEGTDWNVIQNWSGTYGGDIYKYGKELSRPNQLLNGEYGAWRSIGLHTEPAAFDPKGVWSEERMCLLMETKIREAENVKDSVCGQFQWIYSSHDNPGRRQPDEAYRKIDKVGPFNYKGLVTPWEEPLDVYFMYRANYVSADKDPMVYIASHTWPDRFKSARKATIEVYSNCDSVALYNDAAPSAFAYLGTRVNRGIGTHFEWKDAYVQYNVLRAVAYRGGKAVAEDVIVLDNLKRAPHFDALYQEVSPILKGEEGYSYVYRLNCGGDDYQDEFGQRWIADNTYFSRSWAADFIEAGDSLLSPYQASQRVTHDPIRGTRDWKLFQNFRFGRHKLNFRFPVEDGRYRVELYFVEPWHGSGGAPLLDCEGLRIFDVAINGRTVIDDLDIWAERGHDAAMKQVVDVDVIGGMLTVDFPEVKAGQALISAIAIAKKVDASSAVASENKVDAGTASTNGDVVNINKGPKMPFWSWETDGNETIEKMPKELLPTNDATRACAVYPAEDAKISGKHTKKEHKKQIGVFFAKSKKPASIEFVVNTGLAQVYTLRFKYMNLGTSAKPVNVKLIAPNGSVLKNDVLSFPVTPNKWRMLSTTTGTFINAGEYRLIITADDAADLSFDALEVE